MAPLVDRLRDGVARRMSDGLKLLFPPRCTCCDVELPGDRSDRLLLCANCRVLLGPELWPGCPRCGAIDSADGGPPGRCRLCRPVALQFAATIPLGVYDDLLRSTVLRMKQSAHESLSAAIGRLLAIRRGERLADVRADLIVPVPMHWTRRLGRGTNSPEILARGLGQSLRIAVGRRVLVRQRNTLLQTDLSPKERFQNVRGAFRVRAGYRLQGLRVLLIDDILTTGATCSEAAGMLKGAGVTMVAAVVAARAQRPTAT